MTQKLFFTPLFLLLTTFAHGQFTEWIASGRPGQTYAPYTAGKNVFYLQTGFINTRYTTDSPLIDIISDSWSHNSLLRYGLTERLEARALVTNDWLLGDGFNFNTLNLGGRYFLTDSKGMLPAVGIEGYVLLPFGREEIRRDGVGGNLLLLLSNPLTDDLTLVTNFGYTFNQNSINDKYYALSLNYAFLDRWGAYVEIYDNFVTFSEVEIDFDFGVSYLLNKEVQLDASLGWNSDPEAVVKTWFIDLGFSVRFHDRTE